MRAELRLSPAGSGASFAPKTFAFDRPATLEIDGHAPGMDFLAAPASDNAILPSFALVIDQAFIRFDGSSFTLKSCSWHSDSLCVNGQLLGDRVHALSDGDKLRFGQYKKKDRRFETECAVRVHLSFSTPVPKTTNWPGIRKLIVDLRTDQARHRRNTVGPLPSSRIPSSVPTSVLQSPASSTAPDSRTPSAVPSSTTRTGTPARSSASISPSVSPPVFASPTSSSATPTPSHAVSTMVPQSTSDCSPLGDTALPTFSYGDFVDSSTTAARHGHTGASADKDEDVATSQTPESPPTTVVPDLSILSLVPTTSVSTSGLAPEPIDGLPDIPPTHKKTASILLHSAETALCRVAAAWALARKAVNNSGLASAEVAVARMGAAWRQARGSVDGIVLPVVRSADRLGSPPSSSGFVVDDGLDYGNGNDGLTRSPASAAAAEQYSCGSVPPPVSLVPLFQYGQHTPAVIRSPPMISNLSLLPGIFPFQASLTALSCYLLNVISHIPLPPIHHHAQLLAHCPYPNLPALSPIHFL